MSGPAFSIGSNGIPVSGSPGDGNVPIWSSAQNAFVFTAADPAAATPSIRSLGTGAQQAAAGLHASQHVPGGADALDLTKVIKTGTHAARLAATNTTVAPGVLWRETDTGGLIYRCTAATGSSSTWALWKGYGQIARTTDQSITNSSALQNDDTLFWPVEVNEFWQIHGMFIVTAASIASDFKVTIIPPTGATWQAQTATNILGTATGGTPAAFNTNPTGGALTFGSNTSIFPVEFYVWIQMDATHNGNCQTQWAQNTATAGETTTVKAGSFLEVRRLA